MKQRTCWRDCQEWRALGIPLTTTSDEAVKLYDASITQYAGWYTDKSLEGLGGTLQKTIETDPEFVMGYVALCGLTIMGCATPKTDEKLQERLGLMSEIAARSNLSKTEQMHVKAVLSLAEGHRLKAEGIWRKILLHQPQDLLALKFAFDMNIHTGRMPLIRDTLACVLPHWQPTMENYGYLHGLYCFGLEETGNYEKAEKHGKLALEINPYDAWATHSLAHTYHEWGKVDQGLKFMNDTIQEWEVGDSLACHNHWHTGIYHIENGDYQRALDIYDSEIFPRAKPAKGFLGFADASSILFRLEMEGQNVSSRWQDMFEATSEHIDDHLLPFADMHYMMSYIGSKQQECVKKMLQSMLEFSCSDGSDDVIEIFREVGVPLARALVAYDKENFAEVVDLIEPIRYQIEKIGGSHAQRDIFNIVLIQAGIQSKEVEHNLMAKQLLAERKALNENSSLTDRLITKSLALH